MEQLPYSTLVPGEVAHCQGGTHFTIVEFKEMENLISKYILSYVCTLHNHIMTMHIILYLKQNCNLVKILMKVLIWTKSFKI